MKPLTAIILSSCFYASIIMAESWPGYRFPAVVVSDTITNHEGLSALRVEISHGNQIQITYWTETRQLFRAVWMGNGKATPIGLPTMPFYLKVRPSKDAIPIVILNTERPEDAKIDDIVLVNFIWEAEDSEPAPPAGRGEAPRP